MTNLGKGNWDNVDPNSIMAEKKRQRCSAPRMAPDGKDVRLQIAEECPKGGKDNSCPAVYRD